VDAGADSLGNLEAAATSSCLLLEGFLVAHVGHHDLDAAFLQGDFIVEPGLRIHVGVAHELMLGQVVVGHYGRAQTLIIETEVRPQKPTPAGEYNFHYGFSLHFNILFSLI